MRAYGWNVHDGMPVQWYGCHGTLCSCMYRVTRPLISVVRGLRQVSAQECLALTHTHSHLYTHIHTLTHKHTHTHSHTHTHTHTHTQTHTHIHTHTHKIRCMRPCD